MKHQIAFHYSTRGGVLNPDTSKYPRYFPFLMYADNWVIWDSLHDEPIEGSTKVDFQLASLAAESLNQSYNEAMERQRKQVFNQTYFVK
jgi:hypothetical protein